MSGRTAARAASRPGEARRRHAPPSGPGPRPSACWIWFWLDPWLHAYAQSSCREYTATALVAGATESGAPSTSDIDRAKHVGRGGHGEKVTRDGLQRLRAGGQPDAVAKHPHRRLPELWCSRSVVPARRATTVWRSARPCPVHGARAPAVVRRPRMFIWARASVTRPSSQRSLRIRVTDPQAVLSSLSTC